MGGSIRIDGDYVNGTRTVVELPLPEPSAEAALALSQPQPSESPGAALAPGLSWLLVDDNASVRLAHRHTPSKAGTVPGITRALPGQPGNCPPRFLQLGRQPSGGFPAGFSAQLSFPNAPTAGQYRAGPAQASCHGTGHHTAALHAACTLHITHHRCRPLHCHTTTQAPTAVAGLGGGWGDAGPHRTQGDTGPHRAGGVRVARARLCGTVLRIALGLLGHIGPTGA